MNQVILFIRAPIILLLLATLLFGGLYPLAVSVVGQLVFHSRATGSLIEEDGKARGSRLLGQSFTSPKYFWGRLSATTPPYNAAASGGSNLSPANPELQEAVSVRIAALKKADPQNNKLIPVDLVTASASGLDPHISVDAAQYQAGRVARARGMKENDVSALIGEYTEKEFFWGLGSAHVNVLLLNMALDRRAKEKR